MKLTDKIKKLPLSSGVYLFLDKQKKILYVGRSVSLRKRVSQYFQKKLDVKTREMVSLAHEVKYKKTNSLLEAIILEANLIKKHWPKYNVKDKDNRSFVYIVIPETSYPYPLVVRHRELQKFPYTKNVFGPFQSLSLVKNLLKIIRRIFPYSTCTPSSGKPCFYNQIGLCPGVCTGEISQKDYLKNIKNIILLLSGQKKKLVSKLKKQNPEQAEILKSAQDVILVTKEDAGLFQINRIESYDVSHLTGKETFGAMAVLTNGKIDKSQYRLFKIKNAKPGDDLASLKEMIERRLRHKEWKFPDLILIDGGKPQVDYISKVLTGINVNIPLIGISKYGNDKLVFPAGAKKSFKDLAKNAQRTLLVARNEAHRFGLKSSRSKRTLKS